VVRSLPSRAAAVLTALPPVHLGDTAITRNEPSLFGWKLTCPVRLFGVDAVTLRPPALIAAMAPNVCPDPLSLQVCASAATDPEACAVGVRPLHSFTWAVWALPGSAPVTSTTSSGASARTYAVRVMPPPDSCSVPSYRSR
jgi:hypothetical protein